jgi:hypothetical protein
MATLESSLLAREIVRILGVSSLQEAVTNILAARERWNLPDRFVVLYDHQDGGILLDTCTDLQTGQNKVACATMRRVAVQIRPHHQQVRPLISSAARRSDRE